MNVLSVASEVFPLVKTGGLADVTGALPGALAKLGVGLRTLVPGYPGVLRALGPGEVVGHFGDLWDGGAALRAGRAADLDLLVVDAPHLYDRPGGPYAGPDGRDWPDNAMRFAALCRVAAAVARGLVAGFEPDVVHGHDWQAGLVPAYLALEPGRRPGMVFTVHNLAYQGLFPADLLASLRLPPSSFSIEGVEYRGAIGFLKAGLYFADRITTVSPTYAAEIQGTEGGMGLDGLLRTRAGVLSGILNGIDEAVWDPAADPALAANFDARSLDRRARNKAALQARLGLAPDPDALLFGVVSRLAWQKGLDLLLEGLPSLVGSGAQLALLGSGEPALEHGFGAAAMAHPGRVGVRIGYDEGLAHLIQGGSDAILVPSRFEPCGLTQLCALRYGAVPVVARVGGLADSIIDANPMALAAGVATGIVFAPVAREAFDLALSRTAALWRNRAEWRQTQRNAMASEVGWDRPARLYADLYRSLARGGAR